MHVDLLSLLVLENKINAQIAHHPNERDGQSSSESQPWLTFAFIFTLLTVAAFSQDNVSLRARQLSPIDSFVVFVDDFEDLSRSNFKDTFGWGGLDQISKATFGLASKIQNCRQFKLPRDDEAFRFDVKVDSAKPGFRVVGILKGAEENPSMAACIRDKINEAKVASLGSLKPVADEKYRLKLEVRSNIGETLPYVSPLD